MQFSSGAENGSYSSLAVAGEGWGLKPTTARQSDRFFLRPPTWQNMKHTGNALGAAELESVPSFGTAGPVWCLVWCCERCCSWDRMRLSRNNAEIYTYPIAIVLCWPLGPKPVSALLALGPKTALSALRPYRPSTIVLAVWWSCVYCESKLHCRTGSPAGVRAQSFWLAWWSWWSALHCWHWKSWQPWWYWWCWQSS